MTRDSDELALRAAVKWHNSRKMDRTLAEFQADHARKTGEAREIFKHLTVKAGRIVPEGRS